jgi:hypothetical protein
VGSGKEAPAVESPAGEVLTQIKEDAAVSLSTAANAQVRTQQVEDVALVLILIRDVSEAAREYEQRTRELQTLL